MKLDVLHFHQAVNEVVGDFAFEFYVHLPVVDITAIQTLYIPGHKVLGVKALLLEFQLQSILMIYLPTLKSTEAHAKRSDI